MHWILWGRSDLIATQLGLEQDSMCRRVDQICNSKHLGIPAGRRSKKLISSNTVSYFGCKYTTKLEAVQKDNLHIRLYDNQEQQIKFQERLSQKFHWLLVQELQLWLQNDFNVQV